MRILQIGQNEVVQKTLECISSAFLDPFHNINTEYLFLKQLKSLGYYESPSLFTINHQISEILVRGETTRDDEHIRGAILPISFQLKKLLDNEKWYENIVRNI